MKKRILLAIFASLTLLTTGCGEDDKSNAQDSSTNKETATEKEEEVKPTKTNNADLYSEHIPNLTEQILSLDELSYNYISNNLDIFPAITPEAIQEVKTNVDASITAKHLNKNATPYLEKLVTFTGYVVQIEEDTLDDGTPLAIILLADDEFNYYQAVMYKTTGDVLEEDSIQIWGLPLGASSFENVSGGTTNVQVIAASHFEKVQ